MFDLDDGVGRFRDHAAGVNEGGLAGLQNNMGGFAHRDFAGDLQEGGQAGGCAVGVGRFDGITIHRAAAEGGQSVGSVDGGGGDPAQGVGGGDGFGGEDGR